MGRSPRIAGLVLLLAVAGAALLISRAVPVLPAAPLAIALGWASAVIVVRTGVMIGSAERIGSRALRLGVMLLGAQLSLGEIVDRGAASIPFIVVSLAIVFGTVLIAGRVLGVALELRLLMAAGIGICGNSAIAAVAPLVGAQQRHIATAVAMITVVGTAAVFAYPLIGDLLGLSSEDQGVWSGIAIADTAQVVAAGFAAGPAAGEVATIIKLTRNAILAPLVVILAMNARLARQASAGARLTAALPPFVIGFVVLAALRSVGGITLEVGGALASFGTLAILVGLAAVGHSLQSFRPAREDGWAWVLGIATMVVVSLATLLALAAT